MSGPSAATRQGDPAILHIARGREYRSATFPGQTPVEFRSGTGGHVSTGLHIATGDVLDLDDLPEEAVIAAELACPDHRTQPAIIAFLKAWQEGLEEGADDAAD